MWNLYTLYPISNHSWVFLLAVPIRQSHLAVLVPRYLDVTSDQDSCILLQYMQGWWYLWLCRNSTKLVTLADDQIQFNISVWVESKREITKDWLLVRSASSYHHTQVGQRIITLIFPSIRLQSSSLCLQKPIACILMLSLQGSLHTKEYYLG